MADRISVTEFVAETKDDVNSPTTSTFTSKMSLCKTTIASLEESLDADRSALKKMKSAIKAMCNSGQAHVANETAFYENLEKLAAGALNNSKEPEPEIGSAFLKMALFMKGLTTLLKNLISSINNILMFPIETLLKGDLKGIKDDMKRPFDKSWKDYDTKVKQVEREKRQLAKEAGMIRSEITGAEIAQEMEKERRMFQLQMCEYLIKANEIKTKKGVEFLQHLVDFYHRQQLFYSDGFKVIEHFQTYIETLTSNLQSLRQAQDEEKRELVELRNILKLSVSADSDNNSIKTPTTGYNLHQLQGNKALGNEKDGYLMKRSEGLRRIWQKRRCHVRDGFLIMSHNKTSSKDPVKMNLLTSQIKLVPEDKKQFDLVSHNRTYRFMAEDEHDAMIWVSVLSNSKEDALNRVFGDASSVKEQNAGLKELTQFIIEEVRRLPGNDTCCDCNGGDATWLSTNLGVLLCIECSGIHRDMGVHVSRIQSLTLDDLGTSELLLARFIGNDNLNTIMEENLSMKEKPTCASNMEEKKSFIRGKYISRNYVVQTCAGDSVTLTDELGQAVKSYDILALLQLFAEKADLSVPLPGYDDDETALHVAVQLHCSDDQRSILPLVDFLCQNLGSGLNKKTSRSCNTPLHICAERNNTECMKLLLRSKAKTDIENADGETALAIARKLKHTGCQELLEQATSGKFRPVVHIDIDWHLTFMPDEDDFMSDEEFDDRSQGLTSPMRVGTPESSRRKQSSFKDVAKSPVEARISPAIPASQIAKRNRTQSMASSSSANECGKDFQTPTKQPPAIPSKPDHLLTPTGNALTRNNGTEPKRVLPPELPAKPDSMNEKCRSLPRNTSLTAQSLQGKPLPELPPLPSRPMPPPPATTRPKRVRALYDCEADNQDELTFKENEMIVVTGVEDQDWWVGHVEDEPHRQGVFPVSFIQIVND